MDKALEKLFQPIGVLRKVGEKRIRAYEKLGIKRPYDLLFYFPRTYIDFSAPVSVLEVDSGEYACVKGTIIKKMHGVTSQKGIPVYKAIVKDYKVNFTVAVYSLYTFEQLLEGEEYCFYGKVFTNGRLNKEMHSPYIIKADSGYIMKAVYPLTTGLTVGMISANIKETLDIYDETPFETLPFSIREKYSLIYLPTALHEIHFPDNKERFEQAKRRFTFEQLLVIMLGMSTLRYRSRSKTPFVMHDAGISELTERFPFTLTEGQRQAVIDICGDMCGEVPMNRLLQGDVGSGKTAVATCACFFAYKNGFQSVIMSPTEILAYQTYKTLSDWLEPLGVKVALLTGSTKTKERNILRKGIADGEISVVVGTHALFQKDIEYKNLALVITDEQHRFGVSQRTALADKSKLPHKLVMSATPIPRTMSLMIYGDLDISVIRELPKGRIPIETYAVTSKLRERAYGFVRNRLNEGRQAYIVCPLVNETEKSEKEEWQAVVAYTEKIRKGAFKGYKVEYLHGKMKTIEKEEIMDRFKRGEINILVSTTVVEVGVDVPNAVVMIVENAERFGLSQLHQLRGRVGRGSEKSYCILITDNPSDETRERMRTISRTTNGFEIAEADLKLRGPGDFFGSRQHGLPPIKLIDNSINEEIMIQARECADMIMKTDPALSSDEYGIIKSEVAKLFEGAGENSLN